MDARYEFVLRLPATSANLGPGFDTLGLALSMYNRFRVCTGGSAHIIQNTGYGQGALDNPKTNLFIRAYEAACAAAGLEAQALSVRAENNVPLQAGVGSSATAIVAGAAAARLVHGRPIDRLCVLDDALRLEPHPDNLGACLYGGFTAGVMTDKGPLISKIPIRYPLKCWILLPEGNVDTVESRQRLPSQFSRSDVVYSLSRAALLTAAFAKGDLHQLGACMRDRIHEPTRMEPRMDYPGLRRKLSEQGSYGLAVSGSGPALLVLCHELTESMERLVSQHFADRGVNYSDYLLDVDNDGLVVEELGGTARS